jgi:hypothetical protein
MRMKYFRLISVLILLAASPAFAQQLPAQAQMQLQQSQPPLQAQQPPDWTVCVGDNQCTVINACGDKAINQKYVAAFNASQATLKCKIRKTFHANAFARCLNKKCIVIEPGQ